MTRLENEIKIVILGGGFGGINTCIQLHKLIHGCKKKVKVTLISENDHFLFTPMVYDVVTGSLPPGSIIQSLRAMPDCCFGSFMQAKVKSVDLDARKVRASVIDEYGLCGEEEVLDYDFLVMALGSKTAYFDIPGAAEYSLPLKSLEDSKNIKNKILNHFEAARYADDVSRKKSLLEFVIVGGGATGSELAAEIAEFIKFEMSRVYGNDFISDVKVTLVDAADRLVAQEDPWFGDRVRGVLEDFGVRVLLNKRVKQVTKDGVHVDNEFIPSRFVVWAAGFEAVDIQVSSFKGVSKDAKSGRFIVNDFLQLDNYPNVFVIGDQAAKVNVSTEKFYPMRAQFAVREGVVVARNIASIARGKKLLKRFFWKDAGFIMSLGRRKALAKIYGVKMFGQTAWWIHRFVHLLNVFGVRAKMRTVLDWSLNMFLPKDISKV